MMVAREANAVIENRVLIKSCLLKSVACGLCGVSKPANQAASDGLRRPSPAAAERLKGLCDGAIKEVSGLG